METDTFEEETAQDTPPPAARADEFVALLPTGMTVAQLGESDPEPVAEPEPVVAEAPAPAPAPAPAKTVEQKPAKGGMVPTAALHEEREKRKSYARAWEATAEENEQLKAQLETQRGAGRAIKFTPEERAAIREKANKANDLGEAVETVLDLVETKTQVVDKEAAIRERTARIKQLEDDFKAAHPDFMAVTTTAGMWEAMRHDSATGRWGNDAVAKRVLGSPNPAEKLYQLALGKLEAEGRLDDVLAPFAGEVPTPQPDPTPAPAAAPKPAAAPAPATDVAAAERRGAQRVVDDLEKTANRPRGIRHLPSAGGAPRVAVTRPYLDQLMDSDPVKYQQMCDENPALERYHMGGSDRP